MIYKVHKKLVPNNLFEIFTNIDQIHDQNARQPHFTHLPYQIQNLISWKKSIGYRGALVWTFSTDIKNPETVTIFKRRINSLSDI